MAGHRPEVAAPFEAVVRGQAAKAGVYRLSCHLPSVARSMAFHTPGYNWPVPPRLFHPLRHFVLGRFCPYSAHGKAAESAFESIDPGHGALQWPPAFSILAADFYS